MKASRYILLIVILLPCQLFAEPPATSPLGDKPDSYWKEKLTEEQFKVCRNAGTEPAFSGEYNSYKGDGTFTCSSCGRPLFDAKTKFDSGTGWPSFYEPISGSAITERDDDTFFMKRTEVVCSHCGAHLGHVFNDGPEPTGKRYCINSVCLDLEEKTL